MISYITEITFTRPIVWKAKIFNLLKSNVDVVESHLGR
jgi:hypothetical protein